MKTKLLNFLMMLVLALIISQPPQTINHPGRQPVSPCGDPVWIRNC